METKDQIFCDFLSGGHYYDREAFNNFFFENKENIEKNLIAKSAELSVRYSVRLASRFELGEAIISKNSEKSYQYSRDVLRDRFELGEKAILKNAKFAMLYAKDVLKKRWEPAEKIILDSKKPDLVFDYAKYVICGSWLEAEDFIKTLSDIHVFNYLFDCKKQRWGEVEHLVLNSPERIVQYCESNLKDRWIEGEKQLLAKAPFEYKIEYAKKILNGRWKEFEDYVFQTNNPEIYFEYAKDICGGKLPEILHNKMLMLGMTMPKNCFIKKYTKAKKYRIEKKNKIYQTN
jgi:hypothetical protein